MSLKSLVRRSWWYRFFDEEEFPPKNHQLRQVRLQPFAMMFPYGLATKPLDPFDWGIIATPCFLLSLLFLVFLVGTGIASLILSRVLVAFIIAAAGLLLLMMLMTNIATPIANAVDKFLADLGHHLSVSNLKLIYQLSPSELEHFCLVRLQTLADELVEIEKRTLPLDEKRSEARAKLKGAHGFFKHHSLIKDVSWDRFFKRVESQNQ